MPRTVSSTPASTTSTTSNSTPTQQITINADMLRTMLQSIPFIPGVTARARAIPSIRVIPRNAQPVNNNNVNPLAEAQNQNRIPQSATPGAAENGRNDSTERTEGGDGFHAQGSDSVRNGEHNQEIRSNGQGTNANNPHFQYSMQVTPDWIIDSYETAIVGSNEIANGKQK